MGGGKGRQDQPTLSQVPDSTCKVEDRISKLQRFKLIHSLFDGSRLGWVKQLSRSV